MMMMMGKFVFHSKIFYLKSLMLTMAGYSTHPTSHHFYPDMLHWFHFLGMLGKILSCPFVCLLVTEHWMFRSMLICFVR